MIATRMLLALLIGVTLACEASDPVVATGNEIELEYWFADHLDDAKAVEGEKRLELARWRIHDAERRVVYHAAPSIHRFEDVPAGPGAQLWVSPALDPRAWEKPTDGVGFEVVCSAGLGKRVVVLERYSSPAQRAEDRIWHDEKVSLDGCSAPTTDIEFRTSCGPNQNCAADWAGWGSARVVRTARVAPRPSQLVLLVSIDTLRPDRLALYGGPRATSPELERLARDAIVFETAVAPAPWTIPSHASLLTSTDPRVHGANATTPIGDSAPLLAEQLAAQGWQTAGFVDTSYLGADFGFDRGFDHFDDDDPPRGDYRRGARVLRQRILDWLIAANEAPAFVFWHLMDVHGPYWSAPPFSGKFRAELAATRDDGRLGWLRNLAYHDYLNMDALASFDELVADYDEGVAEVDFVLGGLLDSLRTTGLYDDALIVVTSDHGESFLDHGVWFGHGLFLTEDEIRVPLLIKLPGNRHGGTRVADMVGLIDVAPSILDALELPSPASFEGMSLLSPSPGHADALPATRFGHSSNTGAQYLRQQDLKFISRADLTSDQILEQFLRPKAEPDPPLLGLEQERSYDLAGDPHERAPLAETEATREVLRQRLEDYAVQLGVRHPTDSTAPAEPELSDEEKERLRALGYVH